MCRIQCKCAKLLAAPPLCCKKPQHGSRRRYRRGRGSCAYPCPGSRHGKERGWRKAGCDSGDSSGHKTPCCHSAEIFTACESGICWLGWTAGRDLVKAGRRQESTHEEGATHKKGAAKQRSCAHSDATCISGWMRGMGLRTRRAEDGSWWQAVPLPLNPTPLQSH